MHRSHSPQYHRSISEPPCCHGFSCDDLSTMLTDAGLKADVGQVDVVHYLTCLDQNEAKSRFESLHLPPCDILETEESRLPPMIRLNDCYYERDVFPFVVAWSDLFCFQETSQSLQSIDTDSSTLDDSSNCRSWLLRSPAISVRATI